MTSEAARRTKELATMVHRAFAKRSGFTKHALTLNRWVTGDPFDAVHVIDFQGSQANIGEQCRVYVNLGADFAGTGTRASVVKEYECPFRRRVGDAWEVGSEVGDVGERIVRALEAEAVAFFDAHSNARTLLDDLERKVGAEGVGLGHLGRLACHRRLSELWVALGEPEKAQAVLEGTLRFFAEERPGADPQRIHAFAASLGLPALAPTPRDGGRFA